VSSPLLRGLTLVVAMWGIAAGTFWGIGVVYALDELHSGDTGFGIMVSLSAVGSLLGAAITQPLVGRIGIFPTMLSTLTLSVAAVAAMAAAHHVLVAGGLLALISVALSCWIILVITLRQTVVPAHLLGRVSAGRPDALRAVVPDRSGTGRPARLRHRDPRHAADLGGADPARRSAAAVDAKPSERRLGACAPTE
jgi:hypothetical protein